MRVIFLDVDGVLNCKTTKQRVPGESWIGIDPLKVMLLKQIIDETGAQVVLSSSWRYDWNKDYSKCRRHVKYLIDSLRDAHIEIYDVTPVVGNGYSRGTEISEWLTSNEDVDGWVVLDDEVFHDFKQQHIRSHFVKTDYEYGLTTERVNRAIGVLNGDTVTIKEYNSALDDKDREHFGVSL